MLGLLLEVEVERGVDGEAALLDGGLAELRLQLLDHVVDEERRLRLPEAVVVLDLRLDVLLRRPVRLVLRQGPRLDHSLEDVVLAGFGPIEVGLGVVVVGRLDEAREEGRLGGAEVLGVLAEVGSAGRSQAIRAVAVVDALLQRLREDRLLDLAEDGLLGREELDLHQLLGDGAATLRVAARGQVDPGGARGRAPVDGAFVVEVSVLGGDRRGRAVLAHLLQLQNHVVHALGVALLDLLAVAVVDDDRTGEHVVLPGVRHVAQGPGHVGAGECRQEHDHDRHEAGAGIDPVRQRPVGPRVI